jgi:beta-galactosidase
MKLFNGQLVVIVRGAKQSGIAKLTVTDRKQNISNTIQIPVE